MTVITTTKTRNPLKLLWLLPVGLMCYGLFLFGQYAYYKNAYHDAQTEYLYELSTIREFIQYDGVGNVTICRGSDLNGTFSRDRIINTTHSFIDTTESYVQWLASHSWMPQAQTQLHYALRTRADTSVMRYTIQELGRTDCA